ncbi:MAG: hypothetical protein ACREKF_07695 [Candidatus Methylomirabilales bacterium]
MADTAGFQLIGAIRYDGNREYLPRLLTGDPASRFTLRYVHEATYGGQDVPGAVALFNPLTGLGFPTGERQLTIIGRLDIVAESGEVVKSYTATSVLERTRSLWSDETLSELRRKGLLGVRDNIEAQLYQDREFLKKLLGQ